MKQIYKVLLMSFLIVMNYWTFSFATITYY